MALDRAKVPLQDQWNLSTLYPDLKVWEKEFQLMVPKESPRWPILNTFKGCLGQGPETLKKALEALFDLSRKLSKLYTYAHLKHDEDITNDAHKTAYNKILGALHDFNQELSWFEPELLALSEKTLASYLKSPVLADYHFHIEKSVRVKKHMLSHEGEELLALAGKALQSTQKAFGAINDADFKFGTVLDQSGKARELTHGAYGLYIRDRDRTLRANTFKHYHEHFLSYENTLCELLNGQVQAHVFNAKARRYDSSLSAALFPKNIEPAVYHALIKAVNDNIHVLHSYYELREKVMGLGKLHLYDMYVPLITSTDIRLPYNQAEDLIIESVAPLGADYQNNLRKGFKDQRWVDRYENKNKRSGAYSSGCYDSNPYILMNYKEQLKDTFTLAHEAGHSMHSLLSHTHQPYQYSEYPIFLAEVASTFNEDLLMRLMLDRAQSKEERIYLINEKIEDMRGTLFRQTMFAEFELWIHEMAEQNIPLTPQLLKERYHALCRRYFGDGVEIDPQANSEWSRIPHFYYNFYVYQYATGISAALALSERVCHGGTKEREDYLKFLKGGCSRYPIDMLKVAGVDMQSPQPVAAAIAKFGDLVKLLAKELNVEMTPNKKSKTQVFST